MFEAIFGPTLVGAIELVEIPHEHLLKTEERVQPSRYGQAFANILRGMIIGEIPVALRIERIHSKTRVFFLTWARTEEKLSDHLSSLESTVTAHVPKYRVEIHNTFSGHSISNEVRGISVCLTGEPAVEEESIGVPRIDPVDAVGEVIQGLDDILFQVFVVPMKSSRRNVKGLERAYEQALSRSQSTVSAPTIYSDTQQSTTHVNAKALREAERLQKQIKRMSSRYLGKVFVTATHWHQDKRIAESQARRVLSVLMSGISPADKEEDLEISVKKWKRDLVKALAGRSFGDHTVLTPDEAAIYFRLPRCDLGIRVSRREEFVTSAVALPELEEVFQSPSTSSGIIESLKAERAQRVSFSKNSPPKPQDPWKYPVKELILLGYAIRNGTPQRTKPYGVVRRLLSSHFGVYGNTGYGKTTTCVTLAAQAYRNDVIPIIIIPGNVADYRRLKDLYNEFRIFTAGNPDIAPLRLNMWNVPPNVSVGRYIDRMIDIYTATLPNDGVISMHFDDILNTMYENCGWKRMGNVRGRPILLSDLYEAFQEVATAHISYGQETSQDFYGAFEARLRSMLRNDILVDMFNTPSGLSIPDLLAHPTIIETRDLAPEDRELLTGVLTVGITEYLNANQRPEVSHLLILEEAHHLLRRATGVVGPADPTSAQKAKDNIVDMLRTQRGGGLSIVINDQLPGSLIPEVVKLPSNIVIHTLTDLEERVLVGRQALCSDAQIDHIGGMGIGEAVIRIKTQNVPSNIQVVQLDDLLRKPLPARKWTDAMVRDAMADVFATHPELAETHPLSEELHDLLRGVRQPPPVQVVPMPVPQPIPLTITYQVDIPDIVSSPKFTSLYLARVPAASEGDVVPVTKMLRLVAEEFCPESQGRVAFAERVLLHAVSTLQEPHEPNVLADILVALRGTDA